MLLLRVILVYVALIKILSLFKFLVKYNKKRLD